MTERLWSDWIDVIDGKQPDALRGVKGGEWEYTLAGLIVNFTPASGAVVPAYWNGPRPIQRVRILLPEGWQPASTLPSDATRLDVRWTDGDHCEDARGVYVVCLHLLLCWRPHVSAELLDTFSSWSPGDVVFDSNIGRQRPDNGPSVQVSDPNAAMLAADEPKPAEPTAPVLRWPTLWTRESNLLRVADVGEKRWGAE